MSPSPRLQSVIRLPLQTLLCLLLFFQGPVLGEDAEADQQMWGAVGRSDARTLRRVLYRANPNATRAVGETPLMVAASRGDFACARELLWAGADPDAKNASGVAVRRLLKPGVKGFVPLNLLLRCHSFIKTNAKVNSDAAVRHRVIINDSYVDHADPRLAAHYHINTAEKNGRAGMDDDGNGFVDDVSGWNIRENKPIKTPNLGLSLAEKTWIQDLVDDGVSILNEEPGWKELAERLSESYENPLITQLGVGLAGDYGLAINDLNYFKMFYDASHGTHVAGIVHQSSEGKAQLHAMTWGAYSNAKTNKGIGPMSEDEMIELASQCDSYTSFLSKFRESMLVDSLKQGRRMSAYLRTTGCGIVNMSWGKNLKGFRKLASVVHDIYEESGKNPESIKDHVCPLGMDLCDDLGLELLVADAVSIALAVAENPDVLFIFAAGNEGADNDQVLPSPAYMARLFPNSISVASVGADGELSAFSNYGEHSVQVAAPGEAVVSHLLAGATGPMDGTSMAAPAVAGIAAAIRRDHPRLTASVVRRILLASASSEDSLHGRLATAGVVDLDRAKKLATAWDAGLGFVIDESWDWIDSEDRAPVLGKVHIDPPAAVKNPPTQSPKASITALGGFKGTWVGVTTQNPASKRQTFQASTTFPMDWIDSYWKKGYSVTTVAGDSLEWAVVMSERKAGQRLVGYSFDQTAMKANMDAGYRILSMGGWSDNWLIVMDNATGYGEQRYTLPGSWNDARKEWIKTRWNDDMRITSVAGEAGKDGVDYWVVVMSKNSGIGAQTYIGPGSWPTEKIKTNLSEGYRITSVSGHNPDRWVVVMSKTPGMGAQSYSEIGAFPDKWLKEKLEGKQAPNVNQSLSESSVFSDEVK
jgi:hypothetical protein